jgi:carboxyl-terminal processing protease
VKKEEIGMYRQYPSVVLCNGNTASAGELFTAAFRDYDLAPIVGTNTYGKGTMQQFFDLSYFDYEGTLRLTVAAYYPPSDVGYDGVGILPDYVIEPSDDLLTLNSFEVDIEKDNQLQKALSLLQGNQ